MAYDYQSRLQHNSRRFGEVNTRLYDYHRKSTDPVQVITDIPASPIKKRTLIQMMGPSVLQSNMEYFGIDVTDLIAANPPDTLFLPIDGDLLVDAVDGETFRVVQESTDRPPFDYVTSSRDRILLSTVRTVPGA